MVKQKKHILQMKILIYSIILISLIITGSILNSVIDDKNANDNQTSAK